METDPSLRLAEVGYMAYAASTGGKTFDGRDMPQWKDLPNHIVVAWMHAAFAIIRESVNRAEKEGEIER